MREFIYQVTEKKIQNLMSLQSLLFFHVKFIGYPSTGAEAEGSSIQQFY